MGAWLAILALQAVDGELEKRVHRAIGAGAGYLLREAASDDFPRKKDNEDPRELVLLALLHAGASREHPVVKKLLEHALASELESTYRTALTAMCLEEVQRVRHQERIHHCAQFLADNVGPQGQGHYGRKSELPEDKRRAVPSGERPRAPETPGQKPKVTRLIPVAPRKTGDVRYDHSNMQYLALGLRACHEAGIRFDPALLARIEAWWRESQTRETVAVEALKVDLPRRGTTVATPQVAPQGWGYMRRDKPTGAMTAGGVGALCILDYLQRREWRRDVDVLEGLQW